MAYKPRIETNNLDLTSILSTINDLPEAGSGGGTGGGGLETCTVEISSYYEIRSIGYSTIDGTEMTAGSVTLSAMNYTIENVVCNSIVIIYADSFGDIARENCELLNFSTFNVKLFHITAGAGETATISNMYNPYG